MRIVPSKRYPGLVTHVSDDVHRVHTEALQKEILEDSVEELLDIDYEKMFESRVDETFFQFVELYGKRHGTSGILVLNAHGGTINGQWKFQDGKCQKSVQAWINRNGKSCTAIVLLVCNGGGHDVKSRHALTFIPDTVVGGGISFDLNFRTFHYTLLLPSGEEINNDTIDWHIAQIRN